MVEVRTFSLGKVSAYSSDEIERQMNYFQSRAEKFQRLRFAYNDESSKALKDRSLNQSQQLAEAQRWGAMRDTASELAQSEMKKAYTCQIELDLRNLG